MAAQPCSVCGTEQTADTRWPLSCYAFRSMAQRPWVYGRAAGVALARKGAKSRTGGRKPRSTGTRVKPRVAHGRASTARLQQQLEARTRELSEALEQQAVTAEVLRVISTSPTDLQRVFAAVAAGATRLCDASDATIHQVDGALLRLVAHHGPIPIPGSLPMSRGV